MPDPNNPWSYDNPFFEGFESDPAGQRASYFGTLANSGFGGNKRKFFEQQFRNVTDRFSGQIANIVATPGPDGSPGVPAESNNLRNYFTNYFSGGDALKDFYSLSPFDRGEGTSRFAPPVRFLR
jgi:hypothetical protein